MKTMLKNFSLPWRISVVGFVFLFMGGAGAVSAAAPLPNGGSNFETATSVSGGSYQGQLAAGTDAYYWFDVVAGQEINIIGGFIDDTYSDGDLYLYDGNQQELFSEYGAGGTMGPWLNKSKQRMYFRIVNDSYSEDNILSYKIEINSQNRFDAGSQTDAGDTFESALPIGVGSYSGYLAGVSVMQTPYGDDVKDYYKVAVSKGQNYEFKLTPTTGDEGTLELYSASRTLLDEKSSSNGGALVSLTLVPKADTIVYLAIGCGYKSGIFNYKIAIESPDAMTTFYSCKDNYCGILTGYASLQECQAATAQTCYHSADCDGKCAVVTEPAGCTQDADCVALGYSTCADGKCFGSGSFNCTRDADCYAAGYTACMDGNCIDTVPSMCTKNSDCSVASATCMNGVCVNPGGMVPPIANPWLGMGIMSWFSGWYLLFYLLFYIYFAFCLQTLAKKTNTENGWLAWIPIANIVLTINIAKRPLWWIVLILVPIVNIVAGIILWMDIAERRGKEKWIGILLIVPFVGIAVPGYLAFFDYKKKDDTPANDKPYAPTGNKNADKPTVGYKHACKYCDKLIPPDSANCPFCEKVNPLGPSRCPKCHEPVEEKWKTCAKCNQNLRIVCPFCGKVTFFGDHCEDCGARLMVTCPNCKQEQPPIGDNCIKCGKPLKDKKSL